MRVSASTLVAAAVLLSGMVASASAQSCQALTQRLARIDASDGGFSSAVERQREEMGRARVQFARLGCDQGSGAAACGPLAATLSDMTRNLAALQRRTRASASSERADIRRQLAAAGCIGQATARAETPSERPGGLFAFLFGGAGPPEAIPVAMPSPAVFAPTQTRAFTPRGSDGESRRHTPTGGNYRTLCVRTCDGFFWPLSFSTHRRSFQRHEEVCRAQCPNQEVRLFVHRNAGETSDDAVDVDGTPLRDQPGAFRFRTEFDPSCACRPRFAEVIADARSDETAPQVSERGLRLGIIARAPELAEDTTVRTDAR